MAALDDKVDEVERRLSYRVTRDCIAFHLGLVAFNVEKTIRAMDSDRAKEAVKTTSDYLGEKPASTPPVPVIRKQHTHFISADDPIVAVQVGGISDTKKFVRIHQSVLTSSEFFKAKAKPEWSKGEATIELNHVSEDAFTLYANWAYTSKIAHNGRDLNNAKNHWTGMPCNNGITPTKEDWQALAEAVALGEELIDSAFKHSVLDTMTYLAGAMQSELMHEVLCHPLPVQVIYEGTPEGSGARQLMVAIFTSFKDFLEQCDEGLPNKFLTELAVTLLKEEERTNAKDGLAEDPCWYHRHAEGEACGSTTARDWKAEFGDEM